MEGILKIIKNITKFFENLSLFKDFLVKKPDLHQGRDLWRNYKNNNKSGRKPSEKKYSKNEIRLMMLAIDEENDLLKSYKSNF